MSVEFDFSELLDLADDLDAAAKHLPKYLRKAISSTAFKVKRDAQKKVSGRSMLKQAAAAIDYDLEGFSGQASGIAAEVGYNKGRGAGALGNLVEFGAPKAREVVLSRGRAGLNWVPKKGGSVKPLAPGGELAAALHENEDDLVRGVENAVDDAMREAGL